MAAAVVRDKSEGLARAGWHDGSYDPVCLPRFEPWAPAYPHSALRPPSASRRFVLSLSQSSPTQTDGSIRRC